MPWIFSSLANPCRAEIETVESAVVVKFSLLTFTGRDGLVAIIGVFSIPSSKQKTLITLDDYIFELTGRITVISQKLIMIFIQGIRPVESHYLGNSERSIVFVVNHK